MRRSLLAALILAIPLAAVPKPDPAPRVFSPAEEAAAADMVHYLAAGSESIWGALASDSPLRALGHDAALSEIEVRLGPANGAKWRLDTVMPSLSERAAVFSVAYPSGVDDTIEFEMQQENGEWRVRNIRSSVEPVETIAYFKADHHPAVVRPSSSPAVHAKPYTDRRVAFALVLPSLMLAIAGVAMTRRSHWKGRIIIALASVPIAAATVIVFLPLLQTHAAALPVIASHPPAKKAAAPDAVRLGSLVAMRKALASGDLSALHPDPNLPEGPVRDAAALWSAQMMLQQNNVDEAKRVLNRIRTANNEPLNDLLRARIAWSEKNAIDAVIAYEHAMDLGPGRDALSIEAAEALSILGFDDRGERYLRRTVEIGSRDPNIYYEMALFAAMDDDELRAGRLLRTAWKMEPIERASLYHIGPFWQLLRTPEVRTMMQPYVAEEPAFAAARGVHPMTVDAATTALLSGTFLRVRAGGGEIDIPGGAAIAPASSRVVDAVTWRREREQLAVSDFDVLRRDVRSSAVLLQPAIRARVLRCAASLAARNRWSDVSLLTEPLIAGDERVPLELSILRGESFAKLHQLDRLKDLLASLLRNPALKRKKDPNAMVDIAELLVATDDFDSAIKLLERARADVDLPGISQRIEQLQLERQLATAFTAVHTEHLDIHHPPDMSPERVKKIANILEAEFKRLRSSWFPGAGAKRVTVGILSWQDFQSYVSNEYIAGLYTNKVFLPIANVDEFPPEIVAIMTHELAHALIAESTNNLAPRWFHEALASRVEMNETTRNAFKLYRDENFLTVSLLDAVADGSPDPDLVMESYQIGQTTLRYMEAKYGKASIGRMLAAFRAGATTEAAVRDVTHGSVSELDRDAREWGFMQPTLFTDAAVIRYDGLKERAGTLSDPGSRW